MWCLLVEFSSEALNSGADYSDMKVHFITISLFSFTLGVMALASFSLSHAQVRTSSNYQLHSDSINVGGGLSSSTNYVQENTVGEVATGRSSSTNYSLQAGYQQMQEVFLGLSGGADVVMSPDLPGITGGTSNGSTSVTVVTDNPAGYQLTIQAGNSPAMQRADFVSIADYTPAGVADFAFAVPAGAAEFGFSPEGPDVAAAFLDNGAVCGTGSTDTAAACWAGLSTAAVEIARGTGANHPLGASTTVQFQVGISSGAAVEAGLYTATTTITALPL